MATAASPAPQNGRTRCVFGVPPAPKTFHQAQPDTLNFVRTKFCFCSDRGQDSQSAGVCTRILQTLRCRIGKTPQNDVICGICPENRMFSPGLQLALRTPTASPGSLLNASRPHSKLCTRSPLSGELIIGNPPLVPASARNRLLFTCMNSHAGAPKSSGAFFHDMDRERCRKRRGRDRNALRASAGVRPRDVMVNSVVRQIQKRPPVGDL